MLNSTEDDRLNLAALELMWGRENARALWRMTQGKEITGEPIRAAPLDRHESAAVTWHYPKTASLFYDKLWFPAIMIDPDIPTSLLFRSSKDNRTTDGGTWVRSFFTYSDKTPIRNVILESLGDQYEEEMLGLSEALEGELGRPITPILHRQASVDLVREPGDHPGLICELANLPCIDEDALEWDQVLDARKNPDFRRDLRRFFNFSSEHLKRYRGGLTDQNLSEILAEEVDSYKRRLKENGMKTRNGLYEIIVHLSSGWSLFSHFASRSKEELAPVLIAATGALIRFDRVRIEARSRRRDLRGDYQHIAVIPRLEQARSPKGLLTRFIERFF